MPLETQEQTTTLAPILSVFCNEPKNTITELEEKLANLGAQLESPFVKPEEVRKIGTEYERVQKEMDAKLGERERMQG